MVISCSPEWISLRGHGNVLSDCLRANHFFRTRHTIDKPRCVKWEKPSSLVTVQSTFALKRSKSIHKMSQGRMVQIAKAKGKRWIRVEQKNISGCGGGGSVSARLEWANDMVKIVFAIRRWPRLDWAGLLITTNASFNFVGTFSPLYFKNETNL